LAEGLLATVELLENVGIAKQIRPRIMPMRRALVKPMS